MAIFAFEEKQVEQGVLPIAVKRALDALELQLSHEGFSSLPLESRKELLAQGAAEDRYRRRYEQEPDQAGLGKSFQACAGF